MKEKTRPGLVCDKCGHAKFATVYTRYKPGCVQRRKRCKNCGHAIITCEKIIVASA